MRANEVGSGEVTVMLAHATGFCGDCWLPVVDGLVGIGVRVVWWDFRGHGRSGRTAIPVSWWEVAGDVTAVRRLVGSGPVVGVGHSMGGAVSVMAQVADPGCFASMVLVEPIIVPPPVVRSHHLLATLATKRRPGFASVDEARANFDGKGPFARWVPAALDGYLEGGLVPDGEGVALGCRPEFEAEVYTAAGAHGVAGMLAEVAVPVTVQVGAETDTYPMEWARHLAAAFPHGRLEVVDGTGHFIPMERPEKVVAAVGEAVARLG